MLRNCHHRACTLMAAPRSVFLPCQLREAENQPLGDDALRNQCRRPLRSQPVGTTYDYHASLHQAIFSRVKSPRPICNARTTVRNVSFEVFMQLWVRPCWQCLTCINRKGWDKFEFPVSTWEDVQELCKLHVLAASTKEPSQGWKIIERRL